MTAITEDKPAETKPMKSAPEKRKLPVYKTAQSPLAKAWQDVTEGVRMSDLWLQTTFWDYVSQNRRQFLGWVWIPLGMLFLVFSLGYVYAYIFQYDYLDFTLYLFAGFMCWAFIQSVVNGAFSLFLKDSNIIMNVRMPFSYYVYKMVFLHLLPIGFCLPIFLTMVGLYGEFNIPVMLLFFPGIVLYIICGISLGFFLGIIALRFRDLEAPISNVMRLLFLVTPVIWRIETREGSTRAYFAEFNPLYHILEITRAPLLGNMPTATNWYVSLGCMTFLILCALLIFPRFRHRIAYWL